MKLFQITTSRALCVVVLASVMMLNACKDNSVSSFEEPEQETLTAQTLDNSMSNNQVSNNIIIDDFNGPTGSWSGDFPGLYTYLEDETVLGGARELRSYRNGVTRIDGSAGTLEWGGTNTSTEYALYLGRFIGTHGTPTKGSSPNAGKGVDLNLDIGLEGALILKVLNVSNANDNIIVYLNSSTSGWFYQASVTLTEGEVQVPLSSFTSYGSTDPMPAEAAADIDGVRLDGFAHNDSGTAGTGTVFEQIAYSTGTTGSSNVYISDSSVDTYDPIFPTTEDLNWVANVCKQSNDFGINANWSNPHKAFQVTKDPSPNGAPHPWESNTFEAYWINTVNDMDSPDTKDINGNSGPGGHNWTRYETQVAGNGEFVVQLVADNCSWVYLADENGSSPELIGFQNTSSPGEYSVQLDGDHQLIFIIFDGGGLAGGKFRLETTESFGGTPPPPIEPANSDPVADAGSDQTLEATGPTTAVTLNGSGSTDPDGDALTYSWSNGDSGTSTTVNLGVGSHTFTLTVTDEQGATDSDEVTIEITDTTAPELSFSQVTNSLWPPNHKMVLVATGISASDIVDGSTDVNVTVSSNEAANGRGDGNTNSDYEIVTNSDGSKDVYVRSERSGKGNGRTYTISMSSVDAAGNSVSESIEVQVANNRGRSR